MEGGINVFCLFLLIVVPPCWGQEGEGGGTGKSCSVCLWNWEIRNYQMPLLPVLLLWSLAVGFLDWEVSCSHLDPLLARPLQVRRESESWLKWLCEWQAFQDGCQREANGIIPSSPSKGRKSSHAKETSLLKVNSCFTSTLLSFCKTTSEMPDARQKQARAEDISVQHNDDHPWPAGKIDFSACCETKIIIDVQSNPMLSWPHWSSGAKQLFDILQALGSYKESLQERSFHHFPPINESPHIYAGYFVSADLRASVLGFHVGQNSGSATARLWQSHLLMPQFHLWCRGQ